METSLSSWQTLAVSKSNFGGTEDVGGSESVTESDDGDAEDEEEEEDDSEGDSSNGATQDAAGDGDEDEQNDQQGSAQGIDDEAGRRRSSRSRVSTQREAEDSATARPARDSRKRTRTLGHTTTQDARPSKRAALPGTLVLTDLLHTTQHVNLTPKSLNPKP